MDTVSNPATKDGVIPANGDATGDFSAIFDKARAVRRLNGLIGKHDSEAGYQAGLLALAKVFYADGREEIARRFRDGADGSSDAQAQTFLMDGLIAVLFGHLAAHVHPPAKRKGNGPSGDPPATAGLAVVAVGGYGRGDLAPFSDIDILFTIADPPGRRANGKRRNASRRKKPSRHEKIVQSMLYLLWDLGLKVGHATRTLSDNLQVAKADMVVRTGLLESRFVAGDRAVYQTLAERFRSEIVNGSEATFMEAKLTEREKRHKAVGNSRYLLEPNIKEGKGGLRDLNALFWIAKYVHGVGDIDGLVERHVLSAGEAGRFAKARNFLMTLRCHLHYATGRPEERLTFDWQPDIGQRMGYRNRAGARGVERFMKHYFVVAKEVGDLSRIFLAAMRAEKRNGPLIDWRRLAMGHRAPAGFEVEDVWLKTKSGTAFREDPVNFLRAFAYAHQLKIEVHPAVLRQMTRHINRIDQTLREDQEANRLFLDMLTDQRRPEKALSKMSEAGVLGRFIPDFGRVVGQMQHDMYHVYTVDEHTIRAIGILNGIEAGRLEEDHPLATREIPAVKMRRALYAALFMHDLGKGRGGDHSEIGADIAQHLGPRLGLNAAETETAVWLVRHHLLMSNTAFRRDINDPKTIERFAEQVQSMERLRLLLILTVADIRAVGPEVWNAWKATLLRELYRVVAGHLTGGGETGTEARTAAVQARFREALPHWNEKRLARFESLGQANYWLSQDSAAHVRQAQIVDMAISQGRSFDTHFYADPKRDVTEVTVYTEDRPGLFALIAGALALAGGDIVDARIYTLTNGWALDALSVQDAADWNTARKRQALTNQRKIKTFRDTLTRALAGEIDLAKEVESRPSALPVRSRVFTVPPQVHIDNAVSNAATVVEVIGRDRPGLLFALAGALNRAGLQIASAKISTYGERAVDVFYVKDAFGFKINAKSRIETLRRSLLLVLGDGGEAEAEAAGSPTGAVAEALNRRRLIARAKRRSLARVRHGTAQRV